MDTKPLSGFQIAIMASTAGVCVANIYYNQPILQELAESLHATPAQVGIIPVLAQAGYGLGLFFITPLGDKLNRKKLILSLQALLIATLAGLCLTHSLGWMYFFSLLVGLPSVAAQVILPMAASLEKTNKGKTVGIIITGILTGILAARVFSGYITAWLGWRYVYGISAVLVAFTMLLVQWKLPGSPSHFKGSYRQLLGSTLLQVKRFPLLRQTALLGALAFGTFCSFWTTLTFHLGGAPFNYGADIIGLLGIVAIGGALLAPLVGKLADAGNTSRIQLLTLSLVAGSIVLMMLFPLSVVVLVLAVLLLDVGIQATQVTNIATIYTLDESAHSRINTVYMTTYFLGGALGTFAGVQCWALGGWRLVTIQLLSWAVLALLVSRIKARPY